MSGSGTNWAGNVAYSAPRLHYPESVEQVQELVGRAGRVKVLGARHSFTAIADSPEDLLSLDRMPHLLVLDRERQTVTVDAGVRYGRLGRELRREGFALPNMASLPHISVAGACATATHGSGDGNGVLATAVRALELVDAGGERLELSRDRDGDRFPGAVVGLGALGVVTALTLDVVPAFEMRQTVYEHLPLAQLEAHFDEVVSGAYSVSLFTDWQSERVDQVWVKERLTDAEVGGVGPGLEHLGATPAPAARHPVAGRSAEPCTPQLGVPGPWDERLPHFRLEFTPSTGDELQSEYFVPRRYAVPAVRAVAGLGARLAPLLQISEVRTVAADDLWMSPCYRQACIGLHFTWRHDWPAVRELLPRLEEQLAPFDARPHWGKLSTIPAPRVRSLYPRLADFRGLARAFDPRGAFRNAFLDRYVFGED
jgi:xylitol oxidase